LDDALIDRIYESAFAPESWPSVLGQLGEIATARSGWMFVVNDEQSRFVGSNKAIEAAATPLLQSGEVARSQRLARLVAARHPGFLREIDFYTTKELHADPFYQKYIFPTGLGSAAATVIATPTNDRLVVALEREYARGPVELEAIQRLDSLRPHIARSLMTAARLRLERVEAASVALAALGLPAVMLDAKGRALVANGLAQTLAGTLRWKARDEVAFSDRAADKQLREALGEVAQPGHRGVRTFPVRNAETGVTMIAHFLPVRLCAREIFSRCDVALILTPVAGAPAASVELLQSLFDLTPAESRLARSVAEGEPLETIAARSGISRNTARVHLQRVLSKTGCRRQAELASLLGGVRPIGRTGALPPR
jgi:DNA-binding CsgD family transcriptional regulator